MSNIILTTPDELRAIVSEAISGAFPKPPSNPSPIDTITLNDALELLKEHGYPTSKAKIYKLTSGEIFPARHTGINWSFPEKNCCCGQRTKPDLNTIQAR